MCFKSLLSAKIVLIIFIIIGLAIFVLCWYAMFQVEQEFELRQDVLSAVKVKDAATSIVMQNYLTETEAMRYLADPSEKKFQTYLTDFLLGKDKIEDFFLNVKMYNNVVYGGGEDIIENMKSQDESINEIIAMLKNFGADYANQEKSGAIKAGLLEIDAELAKSRVNENMRTFAQNRMNILSNCLIMLAE